MGVGVWCGWVGEREDPSLRFSLSAFFFLPVGDSGTVGLWDCGTVGLWVGVSGWARELKVS